jgi:asparagine synthase (glutamine-hydrolysing)
MCGITGILAFTEEGKKYLDKIDDAVKSLHHRGPDGSGVFRHGNVALGHTRLAIIDTSDAAAQPFTSSDGRYTIVFNGEIFNYKELRAELEKEGCTFRSRSDTEVLLTLYAKEGDNFLNKLNGFFAFAIYDSENSSIFLARDRYGEKPLYWGYSENSNAFYFASELRALYKLGVKPRLDHSALYAYLQLNYIPPARPWSIDYRIRQLKCGTTALVKNGEKHPEIHLSDWYKHDAEPTPPDYESSKSQLRAILDAAVQRRLISDVPIGSFLSGGVDSSIVSALAIRYKPKLQTFSIGFADEPYFDETEFAQKVAKHIGSQHHVFKLTNVDLLETLHVFLNNLDEPFADSSALAVNALAKYTKKHVTVALSGDGADELFGGYNKHAAEFRAREKSISNSLIKAGSFLWHALPASRNSEFGNRIRQLRKFSSGLKLNSKDRYWLWATLASQREVSSLWRGGAELYSSFDHQKKYLLDGIQNNEDMNEVFRKDVEMVLEGDMLVKTDRMSMQHGLEVRSPFLDHDVMEFAMSLPSEYKINRHERKRILKDACRDLLPPEIFTRKKQGFEVPLLKWFRGDLRGMIDELLDEKFLKEQNLFNPEEVKNIRKQLHSNDPGDSAARIWGLIVFQSWWKKYLA